jgi:hypothetical protein
MPWCCSSLCSTEGAIWPSDRWISVHTGIAMQPSISYAPLFLVQHLVGGIWH